VGGGSLFLPILNLVAGLSLKRATAYSSFMVTGGAASNVLYNLACTGGGGPLIDYDIALLFQPCLLLGVSIGVVCNVMFPEWLITVLFSLFLACCTAKTCRAGLKIWRSESRGGTRAEDGAGAARRAHPSTEEPLLVPCDAEDGGRGNGAGFPWKDVALLVMVWLCFFALHVLIGDKHGKVRTVRLSSISSPPPPRRAPSRSALPATSMGCMAGHGCGRAPEATPAHISDAMPAPS